MDLRSFAKELTNKNGIPFMEGREKGEVQELINKIVTIEDYAILDGQDGKYAVFIVKEIEDMFYFAGSVLTENLIKMEEYKDQIKEEGLPTKMTMKKSKNKRNYVSVEFYPEA